MSSYDVKVAGELNRVGTFLADLLERQITPLNLKYHNLKIDDLKWMTLDNGSSESKGRIHVHEDKIKRLHLTQISTQYKIKITAEKVEKK